MEYLSQNISWLRLKLNYSQQKLADELGYSRAQLANWEQGRNYPKTDKLSKIAEYFAITLDALCNVELSKSELAEPQISQVNEENVLYGNDYIIEEDPIETPAQAKARIAALRAYIKTLRKENDDLKDIIETRLNIKI